MNYSPLEIKEFFYKEILSNLSSNNYGLSQNVITKLKELGKAEVFRQGTSSSQEEFEKIDNALQELHTTPKKQSNDVLAMFNDPDDVLKISTNFFPRQPQPPSLNTYDEINVLPFFEIEHEVGQMRSASGNVQVRDEIGSSLRCNVHQKKKPEPTYVTEHEMNTFPMYNWDTGTIDYGDSNITSTVKELSISGDSSEEELGDFPMANIN